MVYSYVSCILFIGLLCILTQVDSTNVKERFQIIGNRNPLPTNTPETINKPSNILGNRTHLLGKRPKTNDTVKSNTSLHNMSITVDINATSSENITAVLSKNQTKEDFSRTNQSTVIDTEKTSSWTYVLPVTFFLIVVIVAGILLKMFYPKWKKGTNSKNEREEQELVNLSHNTSITSREYCTE